ncbi:hypothetical protein LBMAG40_01660 [Cyanobium sp.]|jgi:hypothetical protein|nr:hypothetical protein LBMAG40_01660 [Cyanobium sp.]
MCFQILWTPEAAYQFQVLQDAASVAVRQGRKTKQFGLFQQVEGCIHKLSAQGPRHPGLHSHPFSSLTNPLNPAEKVFESYAQNRTPGAYRVFWCYGPQQGAITIVAITPHP